MAKRVVASVVDFDMHNLFPPKDYTENLEDADSGSFEAQPRHTLRERQYSPNPLVVLPRYEGDFLEKQKSQLMGKPLEVEASNPENLWDFDMPSEWLKHQEEPHPRVLLDLFYDTNRPGDQAGNETLKQYHDRGWDPEDSPEMSEDKYLRYNLKLHAHNVVAAYLMDYVPIDLEIDIDNIRTAMTLEDFNRSTYLTTGKGSRKPSYAGVTVLKKKAFPNEGRWVFATGTGHNNYTTIFEFIPHGNVRDTNKLHVRVSCSCPSWLYWGAQYHAYMKDYLYGPLRPKYAPPRVRGKGPKDHPIAPRGDFLVCKHVLACIPLVSRYKLGEISEESVRRLKRAPKLKIIKDIPKEELRIPAEYEYIGEKVFIKDIVEKWDESPGRRRGWIKKLNNPEEVIYFAHKFPDTATTYVAERLKELAKKPATKKRAEELLEELGEEKPVEIPVGLKKLDTDPSLRGLQTLLSREEKKSEKFAGEGRAEKIIKDMTDPDKLAFIAFKYNDNTEAVSSVIERLKEIIDDKDNYADEDQKKAEHWLGVII